MRHIMFESNSKSSSICRALLENTRQKKIQWVSYENFIEYLELQGIAYDDIRWFYNYLAHNRAIRRFVSPEDTFFAFYDDRLFSISYSKYSGEIRMDFTSSFDRNSIWRGIVDSQTSLLRLYSFVQITNVEDPDEECKELLQATGCIHA